MQAKFPMAHITFGLLVLLTTMGRAEDKQPESLLGFIKPGMGVGIYSGDGSSTVTLRVFSARQLEIVKDARTMSLDQLKEKYDEVKKQIEKKLADAAPALKEGEEQSDLKIQLLPVKGRWGIVKHVGEDYVLIGTGDNGTELEAISASYISRIRLDAQVLTLVVVLPNGRVLR